MTASMTMTMLCPLLPQPLQFIANGCIFWVCKTVYALAGWLAAAAADMCIIVYKSDRHVGHAAHVNRFCSDAREEGGITRKKGPSQITDKSRQ